MIRKLELDEVNKESPFSQCQLDRERYAIILTELIENNPEGFVMSLNNKWGTGKTTFVKMWENHLKNKKFHTIYFNAWENDFENNPLTAIIGELKSILKPETNSSFNKVIEKGLVISKHVLPAIIKALLNRYVDSVSLKDSLEKIAEDSKDLYNSEVDEYVNRKENIKEFRKYLTEFIANTINDKPLVFIIDELDRCRPNYAVALLEQIKHFFNVPNIVFVLSIDKIQLENAVKGVYGTDLIDSEEYLRRFIDLEYSLPQPDSKIFCNYLYDKFNFKVFFDNKHKGMIGNDMESFVSFTTYIFNHGTFSLRQQEKFITHIYAVLKTCRPKRQLFSTLFITLIYLKSYHNVIYNGLRNKKYTIEELQSFILKIFPNNHGDLYLLNNIEANLIFFYNNYYSPTNSLLNYESKDIKLNIKALYDNELLIRSLNVFVNNFYDYQHSSIEKLMDRIELFSQD